MESFERTQMQLLAAAGGLLQEPESALMWKRFLEGARQGRYVKTMTGLFDQYASAHLFIKAVRLYVRSPELEALDAVVADLPGLNANERDSRLTMEAYEDADVILFLLDGERQLSQQGRNSLRQLQRMGAADKVLFEDQEESLTAGLETFISLWERQFVPLAALVRQLLSDL